MAGNPFPWPARAPRIAAVGLASWDRLVEVERYPAAGGSERIVRSGEAPGGTTLNGAVAAARLGAGVRLATLVGDDRAGRDLTAAMAAAGIDTDWVATVADRPTDATTVLVSHDPPERTILWEPGARIARGDRLDITGLFGSDAVILDPDDLPLRRFLTDLPAHTLPATRLVGPLTYLVDPPPPDAMEIALRHDVLCGSESDYVALTGETDPDLALQAVQRLMTGANLRGAVMTRGAAGATAVDRTDRWGDSGFAVEVVDPTGAGDAFVGALAFATALRWDWPTTLRLCNAVAALSTTDFGAQSALPDRAAVDRLAATATG